MKYTQSPRLALAILAGCMLLIAAQVLQANPLQNQLEAFKESDIVFQRSTSYVPFPAIAYLSGSHYGDARVEASDRGESFEYDVDTVSQAAGLPLVIGKRDLLVIGEYLSSSNFDVDGALGDFDVQSFGLPIGWLRQVDPRWQVAGFVMPLGHHSDLGNSDWNWQYMGGAFTRYVQNDDVWWAFGAYVDITTDSEIYIPYLGASWALNRHWTLSAIMPWPAVLYAPTERWLFRFGASPSGASWSISPKSGDAVLNMDAWDLGLGVEYRFTGNFWLGAEAGIGGLRGFRWEGEELEDVDLDASSGPFVSLELKYRPSLDK